MRWTELRGIIAVAITLAFIALAWTVIENRDSTVDTAATPTTSTTTTTTLATNTTLSQADVARLVCDRTAGFIDETAEVTPDAGPGPVAELALAFWEAVFPLVDSGARAEISAVINYYEDYIETAGPFDYDTERIIVEGDKEKLQQLITRPAPGFEGARSLIAFGCGIEVPDQPRMDADDFEDLEDRLTDENDR